VLASAVSVVVPRSVEAGSILSPVAVLLNTAGDNSVDAAIDSTIDQSGLSTGFTSGVTDFDAYLGTNPTHEWIFTDGSEWFSTAGATSGTIVYDLGGLFAIDRLALWNEEFSGIQTMQVETATNAGFIGAVSVGALLPTNTPFDQSYPAEVFTLTPSVGRYVRLTITGPQSPNRGTFLSMGEIAFDVNQTEVPEPASLGLLAVGLGAYAARRRARRATR
jgi:hypothetical protein